MILPNPFTDPRNFLVAPEGAVLVPLTRGFNAIVKHEDAERVMAFRWHVIWRDTQTIYAKRTLKKVRVNGHRVTEMLHQCVFGERVMLDHIDGSGLNCCRDNLRRCTTQQNAANKSVSKNNLSGYKGVYPTIGTNGRWSAATYFNSKQIYIGSFATPEEAAMAYDEKAVELFGEFARKNFPND